MRGIFEARITTHLWPTKREAAIEADWLNAHTDSEHKVIKYVEAGK